MIFRPKFPGRQPAKKLDIVIEPKVWVVPQEAKSEQKIINHGNEDKQSEDMDLSSPSPVRSPEHITYENPSFPVPYSTSQISIPNVSELKEFLPSPVFEYKGIECPRSRSRSPPTPRQESPIFEENKQLPSTIQPKPLSPKPKKAKKTTSDSEDDMFAKTPSDESGDEDIIRGKGEEMDDTHGYFVPQVGEVLLDLAARRRYKIQALKGRGVYSCVVQAKDMESNQSYAIKILRNIEVMIKSGQKEIRFLAQLNEADPKDRRHILRLKGNFTHQTHLCICFEELGMNLREVLNKHGAGVGISLVAVRSYGKQAFIALAFMKTQKMMHFDIKPDNILITEDLRKIKLSDFGNAVVEGENAISENIVARFYRPPEIILGYSCDYAVDVWSLGCTLFELYTSRVLFPGATNSHMLKLIMEVKGVMPKRMRSVGEYSSQYFDQFNFFFTSDDSQQIHLVPISEIKKEKSLGVILEPNSQILQSQNQLNESEELKRLKSFENLLEQCLTLDPADRITPELALSHPFFN
ncbi:PRP4 [Blepharisma stoltei]|uniref:Protein kinase domain-containing protein n=1 Tax=Blepharisma stoltei TaxID=1481888 RepID=A0AAU9J9A4_9CILI|nr:unnamed protein product [Blepharisma stoltei]